MKYLLLLYFLFAISPVYAASATVEVVQSPAWMTLAGKRVALTPGASLGESANRYIGPRAGVVLRLAEGSTVKLGEETAFTWRQDATSREESLLWATLEVLKGAFRFTTTALGKGQQRDIRARVGTATIGIRGTDVWGKAAPDRDFVVLIEGEIEITRGAESVSMSRPQTLFNAPKDQLTDPIAPVEASALAGWAAETEPQAGGGIATADGGWRVSAAHFLHEPHANALVTVLNSAGYPAVVIPQKADANIHHVVALDHYASEADALATSTALQALFPTLKPTVTKP